MLLILSKFFLLYVMFIAIFLITGSFILGLLPIKIRINGNKTYNSGFFSILTGLLAWVIIYSIIKTGFITINVLFLFLFIVFIYKYFYFSTIADLYVSLRSKIPLLKKSYKIILVSIPFFLFEAVCLIKTGVFNFRLPFADFIYYSNLSVSLNVFGQENRYLFANAINPQIHGISFYHYFELWTR